MAVTDSFTDTRSAYDCIPYCTVFLTMVAVDVRSHSKLPGHANTRELENSYSCKEEICDTLPNPELEAGMEGEAPERDAEPKPPKETRSRRPRARQATVQPPLMPTRRRAPQNMPLSIRSKAANAIIRILHGNCILF